MRKAIKPPTSNSTIRKSPGVVGGEARIRNTRIPVWNLIQLQQLGLKDREIRGYFAEPLTDADLKAAHNYYEANPQEIEKAIQDNEAE